MLSQALTAVQNTVAQVGDLFLQQPMEQQLPLVAAMAAGDGVSSSELLFGPLPTDASNVVCVFCVFCVFCVLGVQLDIHILWCTQCILDVFVVLCVLLCVLLGIHV